MGEDHPDGVGGAGWFGEATRLAQGVVSGQMRGHHQRRVEEARSFAGVSYSWPVGVAAGPMGGIMSSSQAGVGVGQMGGVGGAGPLVSALGAGQTGGNHLRGGSLEGARRLGGASNSSLRVAGVGPMGGVLVMGGDEDQMVEGEESSDGEVEAINEPPSTAAHPAPKPLDRVTNTVSIPPF